jgi:hypothetical protein
MQHYRKPKAARRLIMMVPLYGATHIRAVSTSGLILLGLKSILTCEGQERDERCTWNTNGKPTVTRRLDLIFPLGGATFFVLPV